MSLIFSFTVPGEPVAKGRARAFVRGGRVAHYTPDKTERYEARVATFAQQAMAGRPVIEGPVALSVTALFPIPASWPKKRQAEALAGVIRPTKKPDADNITKAVCDGINGVVWTDDVQAVDQRIRKVYGPAPELRVYVAGIDA